MSKTNQRKRLKKVLFITPPYHCGVVEVAGRWLPLNFVYLAGAAMEAGYEAEIYDAMSKDHGYEQIMDRVLTSKPDIVATSAITSTINAALQVLRLAKVIDPKIITLLGGVHPTFCAREIFSSHPENVDFIIRGEGEETIKELLLALRKRDDPKQIKGVSFVRGNSVQETPERDFMDDLDKLTLPWQLLDWKDYTYFVFPKSRLGEISSSRGCSHDCTFCSQQKFWHKLWRGRRPERVVQEIEYLHSHHGVNVILITDEYPTSDPDRWEELLDRLIQKDLGVYLLMETRVGDILRDRAILPKYRKAGIIHIYIGAEATDQDTLDLIKKDTKVEEAREAICLIHEQGMITETSFVLGFPDETKSSINRTLKLAKIFNPDFAHFLTITPWPYADMYQEVKDYIEIDDYSKYNLIEPVIKPKKMTLKEIDKALVDCYRKFYMGKLKELINMKDDFKRKYILTSMRLIMNSSFLTEKIGSLGKIPAKVEQYLSKISTKD
jgi:anaerobic magnesium-protoporphyrin IX monomethyl ester cyclase